MEKTETEPTIFVLPHGGLGDAIVCNAIFRHFAETHNVVIPIKFHNVPSVSWMLRGLPVALLGVHEDEAAKRLAVAAERRGHRVLRLGMFGKGFDEKRWGESMFAHAGIPFEKRWSDWKVERDLSREFEPPKEPYAFVHEDEKRGFTIDKNRISIDPLRLVLTTDAKTDNLFDYCRLIENASEIHVIDSCFAILADSLNTLKAKRKVVHVYARKNALPPTYRPGWEILK